MYKNIPNISKRFPKVKIGAYNVCTTVLGVLFQFLDCKGTSILSLAIVKIDILLSSYTKNKTPMNDYTELRTYY